MTIIPFLMIWGLVFAILLLFCLGIAIALNTTPKKPAGTQPPVRVQAKLRIMPVQPIQPPGTVNIVGLPGRPITGPVIELRNVICNVRFPINS